MSNWLFKHPVMACGLWLVALLALIALVCLSATNGTGF